MKFLARENQALSEHLKNVATLANHFAKIFGLSETAYTCGILHDMGKYTDEFQNYLNENIHGGNATRGSVIHSQQAILYLLNSIIDPSILDMLANVIASHHNGLYNMISDEGNRTSEEKAKKAEVKKSFQEAKNNFEKEIDTRINESSLTTELTNTINKLKECPPKLNKCFALHLLEKALYSCLVDADRCDAGQIQGKCKIPNWSELINLLEGHLKQFNPITPLDKVRASISKQCKEKAISHQGVYTLSVPTGGGKTLSSLRFALEHAKKHNLKRIIYVIPYLSIIEQTAKTFRDVLGEIGDSIILEHHSNTEEKSAEKDTDSKYKLLTDRWDSPIIITTMVQFLETIYSNKASVLRKFHNMSESVIIFDEAQSIPIKCIYLFNDAVNFLHYFAKSTLLICTATQPHLHKTKCHPIFLNEFPEIVSLSEKEKSCFERVLIEDKTHSPMSFAKIANFAETQLNSGKNTLIVVNTKKTAKEIFKAIKSLNISATLFYLSTDLCPAHRKHIVDDLKERLKTKKNIVCVSTQLIEAGVDISFDCVIRAQAGLDSIIQAAGRCNRNGENTSKQTVYIINVEEEYLDCLPEIKDGKDKTRRVSNELQGNDLLSQKAIDLYYDYYFHEQASKMAYETSRNAGTDLYSLLSQNTIAKSAYKEVNGNDYPGIPASFKTAAEKFFVIGEKRISVIVPYENAVELVSKLKTTFDQREKFKIIKELQKLSVSVYQNQENAIAQIAEKIDDFFYFCGTDYYDDELGFNPKNNLNSFMNY